MQDDDGALLGSEAPERQVEQVAVGDDGGDVGDRRAVDLHELDFHRPAPAAAQDVDTGT